MSVYHLQALLLLPFSTAASDVCEAESAACPESVASTCAESDNTAGIIAGVVVTIVAVAFITALTVIVIVVLVLRSRRQPTTK